MKPAPRITLSGEQRAILARWSRCRSTPVRLMQRAKIVLLAAEGKMNKDIAAELGIMPNTVVRWRRRFIDGGLAAIEKDRPRGGRQGCHAFLISPCRIPGKRRFRSRSDCIPLSAMPWRDASAVAAKRRNRLISATGPPCRLASWAAKPVMDSGIGAAIAVCLFSQRPTPLSAVKNGWCSTSDTGVGRYAFSKVALTPPLDVIALLWSPSKFGAGSHRSCVA